MAHPTPPRVACAEVAADGSIVTCNRPFRNLVLNGADPRSSSVLDCLHLEPWHIKFCSGGNNAAKERTLCMCLVNHPDEPWVEICISEADSKPGAVHVEVLDISERLQAETKLREANLRAAVANGAVPRDVLDCKKLAQELESPMSSALAGIASLTATLSSQATPRSEGAKKALLGLKTAAVRLHAVQRAMATLAELGHHQMNGQHDKIGLAEDVQSN